MKLLLIVLLSAVLSACASQPKCVRVAYYDYGEIGCFQHIYQFRGAYYPGRLGNSEGMVIVDKYLGEGNESMFEKCADPAELKDGHYSVIINQGMGSWILTGELTGGEGADAVIDIIPNSIPQRQLHVLVGGDRT